MLSNKKFNPKLLNYLLEEEHFLLFSSPNHNLLYGEILDYRYYFIMKIPNKRELQHIAFNHLSGIDFNDFMNLYKKCTTTPYSF